MVQLPTRRASLGVCVERRDEGERGESKRPQRARKTDKIALSTEHR